MQDTAKYLIHADVEADGVVERSDVVGAVFGQTEGLLGDELDLRELKESSKVGRIHVEIDSEAGRSRGELTVASSLDKVETAVLAAGLEAIERIGPCHSDVRVTGIEDVRAAKRREVVDRAKELLAESFDETVPSSQELLEEVRQSVRVEDVTDYQGLPAGPNVADSDAVVVVEGRADVLQLLKYGIKNAVAVEGTDVPETVGDLTENRTVTAFFDGDRGGDLILRELSQVGDLDYVALAPAGKSVEELERHEVMTALREKVPYESLVEEDGEVSVAATDGSVHPAPSTGQTDSPGEPPDEPEADDGAGDEPADDGSTQDAPSAGDGVDAADGSSAADGADAAAETVESGQTVEDDPAAVDGSGAELDEGTDPDVDEAAATDARSVDDPSDPGESGESAAEDAELTTIQGHVDAVVGGATGEVRLLDGESGVLESGPVEEAFERIEAAEDVPETVVLDGKLSQRVLDVAAQRGVRQVVAHELGEFVKRPTNVRIRTAEQVLAS